MRNRQCCGLFLGLLVWAITAAGAPVAADDQLDRMMEEMNSRKGTRPVEASEPMQSVYEGITSAMGTLSSWFASVRTPPAEDVDEYAIALDDADSPPSANARFWNEAREFIGTARDTIRNFPLPHFYWAPGIVEDYTNVMFRRIDQEFFNQE